MLFLRAKNIDPPGGWGWHNYGAGKGGALDGARAALSAFSHLLIPRKDGNSAGAVHRGYK